MNLLNNHILALPDLPTLGGQHIYIENTYASHCAFILFLFLHIGTATYIYSISLLGREGRDNKYKYTPYLEFLSPYLLSNVGQGWDG